MSDLLLDLGTIRPDRWLRAVLRVQRDVRDTATHAHPQGQLLGSLDGALSVVTPAGRWIVPRAHAVWVPPDLPHALRSHGPFAGWSVHIDASRCPILSATPRTLHAAPLLVELARRAAEWTDQPWTAAYRRMATVLLDEIAAAPPVPLGLAEPSDPHAARVARAILADMADPRPVEAWARWAGTTPRTLARRFRTETGLGLAEWRQRARVLHAIAQLAEGVPVTTVSLDHGYASPGAFIAMFQRATGHTPGRYRRSAELGDVAPPDHTDGEWR